MKMHKAPKLILLLSGIPLAFCACQPVITLDADETPNLAEWAGNDGRRCPLPALGNLRI